MEQHDLLRHICMALDELGIRYFVTGSQATIAFGDPRFTNVVEIVVTLEMASLQAFIERFPESEFYVSREAARDAISRRGMFTIIHPSSGLKIDVIIPGNTAYERQRFDRAKRISMAPDFSPMFSSPDDVILKKLEFYKIGESDKHLRDIAGVLKISGELVDRDYIERVAAQLGVSDIWLAVVQRVDGRRADEAA
jgi:hypothetical protein